MRITSKDPSYPLAETHEATRKIAVAALALLQLAAIHSSRAHAAESFSDFPFLIRCEAGGVQHAYYLSKIGADGVAVYTTPSGQSGTVTLTGKAQQVGGDVSSSCAGQTLEQLRSAGQAYYLQ